MSAIGNFCSGLTMGHVDWNTRHNSRAYEAGVNTMMALIVLSPVVFIFALGFLAGRFSQ